MKVLISFFQESYSLFTVRFPTPQSVHYFVPAKLQMRWNNTQSILVENSDCQSGFPW